MAAPKEKLPEPAWKKTYLIVYNTVQLLGWLYILVLIIKSIATGTPPREVYPIVKKPLMFFQILMGVEIFHALFGVVQSPWFSVVMQLWGRYHSLVGAVWLCQNESLNQAISVIDMITMWSLAEVTRYAFYLFAINKNIPKLMTWIRYSLFIPVYPLGVSGEFFTILFALKYFKVMGLTWYYWFSIIILCSYPFGFGQLYMYMLNQRKKHLGGKKTKKSQ